MLGASPKQEPPCPTGLGAASPLFTLQDRGWPPRTRHKGPPGCPSQQGKAAARQAEHLCAHRHHPSPAPCTFLSSSWDASGTPLAQKPLRCRTEALGAGQGSSTALSLHTALFPLFQTASFLACYLHHSKNRVYQSQRKGRSIRQSQELEGRPAGRGEGRGDGTAWLCINPRAPCLAWQLCILHGQPPEQAFQPRIHLKNHPEAVTVPNFTQHLESAGLGAPHAPGHLLVTSGVSSRPPVLQKGVGSCGPGNWH